MTEEQIVVEIQERTYHIPDVDDSDDFDEENYFSNWRVYRTFDFEYRDKDIEFHEAVLQFLTLKQRSQIDLINRKNTLYDGYKEYRLVQVKRTILKEYDFKLEI